MACTVGKRKHGYPPRYRYLLPRLPPLIDSTNITPLIDQLNKIRRSLSNRLWLLFSPFTAHSPALHNKQISTLEEEALRQKRLELYQAEEAKHRHAEERRRQEAYVRARQSEERHKLEAALPAHYWIGEIYFGLSIRLLHPLLFLSLVSPLVTL